MKNSDDTIGKFVVQCLNQLRHHVPAPLKKKRVKEMKISLESDKSNGYFTWNVSKFMKNLTQFFS